MENSTLSLHPSVLSAPNNLSCYSSISLNHQQQYPLTHHHTITMNTTKFHRFHETWLNELHQLTTSLSQLLKKPSTHGEDEAHLIHKFTSHLSEYYRVKSLATRTDVLSLFSPTWCSSLERSLYWVAGFRPTTIFHLIYTESSVRFESHLGNILRGYRTGDLGELSPGQMSRVSELQCRTVKEENEISEELSEWQDGVVLVGEEWTASMQCGCTGGNLGVLAKVVEKADNLRMRTLKEVVELLTAKQAAEFLVAAAELYLGLRAWGFHLDEQDRERAASEL